MEVNENIYKKVDNKLADVFYQVLWSVFMTRRLNKHRQWGQAAVLDICKHQIFTWTKSRKNLCWVYISSLHLEYDIKYESDKQMWLIWENAIQNIIHSDKLSTVIQIILQYHFTQHIHALQKMNNLLNLISYKSHT